MYFLVLVAQDSLASVLASLASVFVTSIFAMEIPINKTNNGKAFLSL